MKKSRMIIVIGLCIGLLAGALLIKESFLKAESIQQKGDVSDEKQEDIIQDDVRTLSILAVGDIMTHSPQLKAHYDRSTDSYDFKNDYTYVRDIIKSGDLALCNIETTFAGNKKAYSGYPSFNTPDALMDAVLYSGFDVAVTANNHSMDTGKAGFLRTLELLRFKGLPTIGTQLDEERPYEIIYKQGIKIGLTSFTYETEEYRGRKTINGIIIPQELEDNINTFNYSRLDEDLEDMKKIIEDMQGLDVDVIIFYIHWGNEYHLKQNIYQEKIAAYLSEQGVDVIFGSHPHVVQPIQILTNSQGQETVVFYSLGNFISNQRYELSGKRHTEDGLIGQVTFSFNKESRQLDLKEVKAIPTWVHKRSSAEGYKYEIIPLPAGEALEGIGENALWRARNSYNNTMAIIGKEYLE